MTALRTPRLRRPIARAPAGLVPFLNWHAMYLCERMRPDEIEQYLAFTSGGTFNPETAAAGFIGTPGVRFTLLGADTAPVACGGFEQIRPGIWQSWMVGTMDGWDASWRSLTKACRFIIDNLFDGGARRVQTSALASRTKTLEWYERGLGLVREGTARQFGAGGEDVALYARTAED